MTTDFFQQINFFKPVFPNEIMLVGILNPFIFCQYLKLVWKNKC
jgi:hypothetical protein